jgi:hypothetical protein
MCVKRPVAATRDHALRARRRGPTVDRSSLQNTRALRGPSKFVVPGPFVPGIHVFDAIGTWRGWRKRLHVIARSPCDEAIQSFCVAAGLLRSARNDGETPRSNQLTRVLRRKHPAKPTEHDLGNLLRPVGWVEPFAKPITEPRDLCDKPRGAFDRARRRADPLPEPVLRSGVV